MTPPTGNTEQHPPHNRISRVSPSPTALLAGGVVRGCQIYGASDKIGAYRLDQPVQPEHIAATVYDALGIYNDLWATNFFGQPFHLLKKVNH